MCFKPQERHTGDFISQSLVEDYELTSYIMNTSSGKICSGLDNSCRISLGSIHMSIMFINEVNKKSEIISLSFKILKQSPVHLIIGRNSIKNFDLISRNPSHFYSKESISKSKFYLLSSIVEDSTQLPCSAQEGPVKTCGCQRHSDLQSAMVNVSPTEIQVEATCNRFVRRSSESAFVEGNMLRTNILASFCALCDETPLTDPRVGSVLSNDTPLTSLMAVTQTLALYSSYSDVKSYKLNDELLYKSLYMPLHETPSDFTVLDCTKFLQNLKMSPTENLDSDFGPTFDENMLVSAVLHDLPTKFIDEDGIDQLLNDTFAPWIKNETSDVNILEMIHVEGDAELQEGIRALCKEYAHIFALKLTSVASKLSPFNITVDTEAWRVPKNRMPPRQ